MRVEFTGELSFEHVDRGAHGLHNGDQLLDGEPESSFDPFGLTQRRSFQPGENLVDQAGVVAPSAAMQDRHHPLTVESNRGVRCGRGSQDRGRGMVLRAPNTLVILV